MNINLIIAQQISESIATKEKILGDSILLFQIKRASEIIIDAYKKNCKTLVAGNGGSAADAQHIAAELVSRFYFDRPGLPSIALSTDTSVITAISNDFGFAEVYSRQIKALGNRNDVFIGISTSGNSANIVNALNECKIRGIRTIGLTGMHGGKMDEECDICIKVPSMDTPRIQESHIMIGHIICCIVEEELFGNLK